MSHVATVWSYPSPGAYPGSGSGRVVTTRPVNVGYYLSTDSMIATTDRRIATRAVTLGREDVDTLKQSLLIPTDLVAGRTYWIGAIVDWDNLLVEVDASNNAAYHTVLVN